MLARAESLWPRREIPPRSSECVIEEKTRVLSRHKALMRCTLRQTVLPTSRRAELYRALQRPVLDVKASNIGFDSPCYTETMKFYTEPDSFGDASRLCYPR